MKRISFLLRFPLVLLAVLALTACPPDPVEDFLSASSDKVEIVNGRGEVTILSNVKWNVTSKPTWLNCPETEGQGEKLLQFTAEENPDTTQRSGTLTVKSTAGNMAVNINVWQKGTPKPGPDPDPDVITLNTQTSAVLNVAFSEGEYGVTVSASNSWSMSEPEYSEGSSGWITFANYTSGTTYGKGEVYVKMNIKENPTVTERSAVITFTCGKASARLTVNQAKAGERLTIGDDKNTTISHVFKNNEKDSVKFKVESNVTWKATSDKNWCKVSPEQHSNDGEITIVAEKNDDKDSRPAVVTVSSGNLTCKVNVTQPGRGAFLTVNNATSTTVDFTKKDADSKTFSIQSNVSWEVSSDQNWCTVSPKSGSNGGTVTVNVTANTGSTERTATVTVKGGGITRTVTVTQAGEAFLTVDKKTSTTVAFTKKDAGSKSFSIESNVSWEVSSDQSWCTVSPKSGSNGGTVTVNVTANTGSTERTATVTVKGGGITRTVTVTQAGEAFLTVDKKTSTTVAFTKKDAGSKSFSIESNVSWEVSSDQSWCTVSPKSGSNNGTVTVNVTANTGSTERTATVTVKGGGITRTVTVTQAGEIVILVNNSTSTTVDFDTKDARSKSFSIESNVSWEVSSNQSWCTVSPKSGSNNGTVTVNVTANTGSIERTATVTVKGGGITRTVTVTQAGEIVILVNNSTSTTVDFDTKDARSKTFTVQSNVSWEVSSDQSWCTVSPKSGSNNGTVTVNVTANPVSTERTAKVTVKGGGITRTVTVTQPGEPFLTVDNKTSTTVAFDKKNADSKIFSIESNVSWEVSSDKGWCTVSPSSGKDYGTVTVYVTANTGSTNRTATVIVTGGGITRRVTVTQVRPVEKYLRVVEENSFSFDRQSSISNFRIESNVSWTINSPDWITLSQYSGLNDARVSATVKEKKDEGSRNADIIVSGDGVSSKTIHVTQSGVTLSLSTDHLELDAEGNSRQITIYCNGEWNIDFGIYHPEWCTIAYSDRMGNGDKTISIAANKNTGEQRSGHVTITSGNVHKYLTVVQEQGRAVPGENDNPLPQYSRKKK